MKKSIYKKLGKKSGRRCWYCGDRCERRHMTRDHQEPASRGGADGVDNTVLACEGCNSEKGDMDVETYRWFLQDRLPAGERVVFYGERAQSVSA